MSPPAEHALEALIPSPRLLEIEHVDIAIPPERAWALVRHRDFGHLPFVHALFAIRTLPSKIRHLADDEKSEADELHLSIDELLSTPERPGFQILAETDQHEVVVGAIGKVWHLDIPFVHVASADEYARFREPGFVKVAWALRVTPLGERDARVTFEVRVDATDDASFAKFRRYFRLIGPGSHLIRHALLADLVRECGAPEGHALEMRPVSGDALIPDTAAQVTHDIVIRATPERIWPWLVQMGCRRGGFYSYDTLDNGGARSAREVHADLQSLAVGDVIPARPKGNEGFEVLRIEPNRALILGGLYDLERGHQLLFAAERPPRFWQATWAFALEPLDAETTRLVVRARVAFPRSAMLHAGWMWLVHHFMQRKQLENLAARVEGTAARDDWHDVIDGTVGALAMLACFATPFMRRARSQWGVDEQLAKRTFPGDDRVPNPRWQWTHGIEIDRSADEVWPWIAQIGADRGGFYSYQWLENIAGCNVRNAEVVHPEWADVHVGDGLRLHPKMPPLAIVEVVPKRAFVAYAGPGELEKRPGNKWVETTWLFYLEPIGPDKCLFVSRYRIACSDDLVTRLQFGPLMVEPIGFTMDRRMLLGVKERAERQPRTNTTTPTTPATSAATAATPTLP